MRALILLLAAVCIPGLSSLSFAAEYNHGSNAVTYTPDVTFTLRTDIADGKLVFVGETDAIAGKINPDLKVPEGAVVQINLINGDGAVHDIAIPEFSAKSGNITAKGAATTIVFRATHTGNFEYLCTLPGHKAAGMFGQLIAGTPEERAKSSAIDVAQDPHAVGEPVGSRGPKHVMLDLESTEIEGRLSDGSTYNTGPSTTKFRARLCA